ncbi:CMGC/CDK protein kinase [Fonticula alba]|uniref:CMGC/CDK protein kinase n=1 Tax=Fonticula alba TaxID=691883 RepID=A0A058Z1Y0_FONAL|nr:CMGC/CDK protein kinase [Fonticula alba]KCV68294.1 CMGC/CDK protein kinase [Fonticula alba]|eukprot:XP_009497348.1 CMGC/CDK protein kinase [Fonticula alba]
MSRWERSPPPAVPAPAPTPTPAPAPAPVAATRPAVATASPAAPADAPRQPQITLRNASSGARDRPATRFDPFAELDLSPADLRRGALPLSAPGLRGCRRVAAAYTDLQEFDEGAYGVVYRAKCRKTGETVALKRLKPEHDRIGFSITTLREVSMLLTAHHPHVIRVLEIVVGSPRCPDDFYIAMEYASYGELKQFLKNFPRLLRPNEVKMLMQQLLSAVDHLHDKWIIHRDLKPSNLFLDARGHLKVGDFGLARAFGSPVKEMSPNVVTLWYRAAELLLGSRVYTTAIDMWSVGCIFYEIMARKPLFPAPGEFAMVSAIFDLLGTPNEVIWPGVSSLPFCKQFTLRQQPYNHLRNKLLQLNEKGGPGGGSTPAAGGLGSFLFGVTPLVTEETIALLSALLTYDPAKRLTARDALNHPYFSEDPPAISPSLFPRLPSHKTYESRRRQREEDDDYSGGAEARRPRRHDPDDERIHTVEQLRALVEAEDD